MPVVGDEEQRAIVGEQRLLERFAAGDIQMGRGLVEHQHVGMGDQEPGQRQARALAAAQRLDRLVHVVPVEEEPCQVRPRVLDAEVANVQQGFQHCGLGGKIVVSLAMVADIDVMTEVDRSGESRYSAQERLDQRGLADAVRAHDGGPRPALELHVRNRQDLHLPAAVDESHPEVVGADDDLSGPAGHGVAETYGLICLRRLDPFESRQAGLASSRLPRSLAGLVAADEGLFPGDVLLLPLVLAAPPLGPLGQLGPVARVVPAKGS